MEQVHREPCTWEQFKEFEARFVKPLLEAASLSELWLQPKRSTYVTAVAAAAAVTAAVTAAAAMTAPEDTQQQQLHLTAAICLFDVQADQVALEGPQYCCQGSCTHLNNGGCCCNRSSHSCDTSWLRGWWLQPVRCACSQLSAAAQEAGSMASGNRRLEAVLRTTAAPAAPTC
eukprot:3448-Heterococcus_DN1.PRE.2